MAASCGEGRSSEEEREVALSRAEDSQLRSRMERRLGAEVEREGQAGVEGGEGVGAAWWGLFSCGGRCMEESGRSASEDVLEERPGLEGLAVSALLFFLRPCFFVVGSAAWTARAYGFKTGLAEISGHWGHTSCGEEGYGAYLRFCVRQLRGLGDNVWLPRDNHQSGRMLVMGYRTCRFQWARAAAKQGMALSTWTQLHVVGEGVTPYLREHPRSSPEPCLVLSCL